MKKRYLAALGGALLASFVAAGIALAGEPPGAPPKGDGQEWTCSESCDGGNRIVSGDAKGGSVEQTADQDNVTLQDADATAKAIQFGGLNLGLNVLSRGDLEQANRNENEATAENSNGTVQVIGQDQDATGGSAWSGDATGGNAGDGTDAYVDKAGDGLWRPGSGNECVSKCDASGDASSGDAEGGDVEQDADQDNFTYQDADATAKAIQVGGANAGANVLGFGDRLSLCRCGDQPGGSDLEQANRNENEATAKNSNWTAQLIGQHQDATGGSASSGEAAASGKGWHGADASSGDAEGGDVEQDADQSNATIQDADATAKAIQFGGVNLGLNVLSSGDLEQTNSNENEAKAENSNGTVQVIGQRQDATGGDATSGNAAASGSGAGNCFSECGDSKTGERWTGNGGDASSGDAEGGDVEQDADQDNFTYQDADATAKAIQVGGVNLGINLLSSGDLEQTNSNENEATAENSNGTAQLIGQGQSATGGDATSGAALGGLFG